MTGRTSPVRFYAMFMMGSGLIAFGIMLFFLLKDSAPAPKTEFSIIPVEADYPVPELDLYDLSGNPVSLRDYSGSVVLVNLWATWCPPC
jgi:thiol-disulfide isomerase/thioredoxin